MLTGEALYALYVEAMAEQGCEVDPWADLGEVDRTAWDSVAAQVSGP